LRSVIFNAAGIFIADGLAGMAAMAVIGVERYGFTVNDFVNLAGA
jgi:hypothetical protein